MAQALIPAAVGTGLGILAGNLLAQPVLAQTESAYKTTGLTVAWWVNAVAVAVVLGVVASAAWLSARRAGQLRTVDALAVGRTPSAGRGLHVARLTAKLPLPRSISLGLARPFARPARAGAMVSAVVFGAAAVTFTFGLTSSLGKVLDTAAHVNEDVVIRPSGPAGGEGIAVPGEPGPGAGQPQALDSAAIEAAINSQAGTSSHFGTAQVEGPSPVSPAVRPSSHLTAMGRGAATRS